MLIYKRNIRNDSGDKVMIDPRAYLSALSDVGVRFYTGVPDSLLKDLCACLSDTCADDAHIIAANEGGAIGLAIGHHLACGRVAMVYLQNSGFGNTVNPLLSLASSEVYGVPMIIVMGWRGEPGVPDEPQHLHQGRVIEKSLTAMEIPYVVLSLEESVALSQTQEAVKLAESESTPVVILVKKGTFSKYSKAVVPSHLELSREDAISTLASAMPSSSVAICTTGMPSRELFECRAKSDSGHHRDFLCVGGMGHASQIGLAFALEQMERSVFCIDGDGAVLMHLGSFAIIGQSNAHNFIHVVLNNGVHDSVGGQPTVALGIDLCAIAYACGYSSQSKATDFTGVFNAVNLALKSPGPHFIEVLVRPGNRSDLGRPTRSPQQNKVDLMEFIESGLTG